jgi:hypothetical protein
MLTGSIDLSKVDKNKIVSKDKKGQPFQNGAKYLNVVVWLNDAVDQYGNIASIQEGITKEDRDKGVKATYIGNLKNVQGQNLSDGKPQEDKNQVQLDDDGLPF